MAKLTLAELRRRVPNLPEAELKAQMQIIRRWEKWIARATQKRTADHEVKRNFDPRKLAREELALLRKEFEDGDPLSLNEAFLMCCRKGLPDWVRDGLASRLSEEIRHAEQEKRPRRKHIEHARWFAIDYFRRRDHTFAVARQLAAKLFGLSESTMERDWKSFRRKRDPRPDHRDPLPEGFENVMPTDFPGAPESSE